MYINRVALWSILTIPFATLSLAQGVVAPPPPPMATSAEEPMSGMRQDIVIVSGTAAIDMTPDTVSFTVGVETEGLKIRTIVEENSAKVGRILKLLKNHGIKSEELRTSAIHLTSVERHEVKAGYQITNEIGVTRKGTADVGDLIAAAIEAGANNVRGPDFSVSNEKPIQNRCIELAFADAEAKAMKLATLAKRTLGKVLAVTDGSSSPFEFKYHSPGVEGGVVGGFLVEPGVHSVDCGVTVAFRLD
jgi:uncharacterized protein YggE